MSTPKPSTARPPKRKGPKPAPVPKQPQKSFKSAELIEDSEDQDDVKGISAIKANKDTCQKPLKVVSRAKSPNDTAKQTSVRAKAGKKSKSKSSSPNVSENESSDAGIDPGEVSPHRKGRTQIALWKSSQKGTVVRPETKVSATDPRKADSDGYTSSVTESESSESEEPRNLKQKPARARSQPESGTFGEVSLKHVQKKSRSESRRSGKVSSKPVESAQKSVPDKVSETSEEDASGIEKDQDSGRQTSSESEGEQESQSEESDHSTLQRRSKPPCQVTIEPPLLPYAPSSGFEAATISVHTDYNLAELLSPLFLQKKQMWHITAPASVPISSITEVSKQSVTDGLTIMSYKGAEYGLLEDNGDPHESLLLPSAEANSYNLSSVGVTRTLRLQQIVHPGSKGSLPNTAAAERSPYTKPTRKQLEGLKMRYKPFGASESEDSHSESLLDGTSQVAQFRVPQGLRTGSPIKKRKRDEPDADNARSRDQSLKKARKGALPTNGTESTSVKEKPKKHKSSRKDKDAGRNVHHSSMTAQNPRPNHDREPISTEASHLQSRSESSKQRREPIPPVNAESASPTTVSLKHTSKPERKRDDSHSASHLRDGTSPRKHSSLPTTRTDHDRDATVGAPQRALKAVNGDSRPDGKNASAHKKSKHRDETPEERAKRRAEKRRKKEERVLRGLELR